MLIVLSKLALKKAKNFGSTDQTRYHSPDITMKGDFLEDSRSVAILFVAIIILTVGVTGNILVIAAVWKKRSLRSTTNYLLVNLAVSDLTTLVSCTFMAIPEFINLEDGTPADVLCKFFLSYHLPITASLVSILTLTVLSVERYHAVVKPMKTGIRLREETVKYANIGVWAAGVVLSFPLYVFSYYKESSQSCRQSIDSRKTAIYQISVVILGIMIPFFIISFCYFQIVRELYFKKKVVPQNVAAEEDARAKRKIIQLSLTVTVFFVLFLLPLAITIVMKIINDKTFGKYYKIAVIVFFAEAGINPLIYSFQSSNFRQAFKEIFTCL